ncbi:NAD-dependent succinate-semialdehyde dehydrogenase [Paraburkholderia panacisoli]|uniref:NAD-dependent succinate-semialdehyde dehydrogenase n=1 Tax=Paraburkholderia panacisoli TaxID=2603818 RepID=A0A5B0GL49_9BURK|nr:NAD-dependent succinate-semialdehyde dehydrogenase [Paraburkholderia panacisoli]KAA1004076.1 NAD-dependent succinate-semialdehyde dehydrogenase [Paraburkholderia panacisoli]
MTTPIYPNTQLHIDGVWQDARDGRTLDVVNPATGVAIATVAHAGIPELDRALSAAHRAFGVWRDTPAYERSAIMRRAAALLRERSERIAAWLTEEQGKPLGEAKTEVSLAAGLIEWFAEEGFRVYGRIVPSRNLEAQQLVVRDPVGPVAAFTPWNFPINQVVRKMGAALATGCSIIVKAPEETPAAPAELVRAFVDAGIPPGVIGLVYGNPAEISNYLIPHPIIRKVTFTGSTAVGKELASLAGRHMKRVTMELGGHAPFIVAEDADLERALDAALAGKFRNAGQVCISPTRFLVQRDVAAEFGREFGRRASKLQIGDGLADGTQIGALANPRRIAAMDGFTRDAIECGATLVAGGERVGTTGNFWKPTVLADVPREARVFNDEPFGPIAAIQPFDTLEDAIVEANRLPYGLSGYAFTQSLRNTRLLTRGVEVGMLWINQTAATWPELPFSGVKDSGYGSEGGPEAMDAYLNSRTVSVLQV